MSLGGWWCSCVIVKLMCAVAKREVDLIYKANILGLEYLAECYLSTLSIISLLVSFMIFFCLVPL